jgi:hypothetical protein
MARLQKGEREECENLFLRLLRRLRWGARESEIAEELGRQRCTFSNYLNRLKVERKEHREERSWFAQKSRKTTPLCFSNCGLE